MPAELPPSEGASLEDHPAQGRLDALAYRLGRHTEVSLTIHFAWGSHLFLLGLFVLDTLTFICKILNADPQLFK